jgi:ATP-dependent RNA/DNA helicase IGHMBP2
VFAGIPVMLEKTKFDTGERLLVKVSRSAEHKDAHLFQSGKLVSLFSNAGHNKEDEASVNAVINYVREHEMVITLNSDEFPDWIRDGKLGIQLLFDENSYQEMFYTLRRLEEFEIDRVTYLSRVLLGDVEAEFDEKEKKEIAELNQSQNQAINLINSAKDLAIVHGASGNWQNYYPGAFNFRGVKRGRPIVGLCTQQCCSGSTCREIV